MRQRVRGVLLVLAAMLAVSSTSYAQQEAVLGGIVRDTTGGVLPGVVVRAVHEATGNSFEAVTDEAGGYRLAVRVGICRVSADLTGFAAVTQAGSKSSSGSRWPSTSR